MSRLPVAGRRLPVAGRRWPARVAVILALVALEAAACSAQSRPRRSQLGSVAQEIAGTRIEIVYRRPVARGRSLFGALVPWGEVWTPSADSAAQFTVSRAIEVNGLALEAGRYSIWAIPDSAEWTVIFNRRAELFHLRYPANEDALRVRAVPVDGPHVETLEFAFPMVDADSARLELRWGTTVVPLRIRAGG